MQTTQKQFNDDDKNKIKELLIRPWKTIRGTLILAREAGINATIEDIQAINKEMREAKK